MMTRSRSTKLARLKIFIALPAVLTILFFFSDGPLTFLAGRNPVSARSVQLERQNTDNYFAGDTLYKDSLYRLVEKMPYFPGGSDKLVKFLVSKLKYPEAAKANGIEGKVFVRFVVKKDGTITGVSLLRGIGGGCDEEATRVVKLMPKWIPGEKKGEKVDVEFVLPIQFKLGPKVEPKQEKKN